MVDRQSRCMVSCGEQLPLPTFSRRMMSRAPRERLFFSSRLYRPFRGKEETVLITYEGDGEAVRTLLAAGWTADGDGASKRFASVMEAILEFENLTGMNAHEVVGCSCGPPPGACAYDRHRFSWEGQAVPPEANAYDGLIGGDDIAVLMGRPVRWC